jgi:hypothetical protein
MLWVQPRADTLINPNLHVPNRSRFCQTFTPRLCLERSSSESSLGSRSKGLWTCRSVWQPLVYCLQPRRFRRTFEGRSGRRRRGRVSKPCCKTNRGQTFQHVTQSGRLLATEWPVLVGLFKRLCFWWLKGSHAISRAIICSMVSIL